MTVIYQLEETRKLQSLSDLSQCIADPYDHPNHVAIPNSQPSIDDGKLMSVASRID